jgi:predicted transcriptional regulator
MNGSPAQKTKMGKALLRVFRQEDLIKGVEEQPASVSFLMNEVRRSIFLHLCLKPCDHVRGIARSLEMSPPGVSWHIKRLYNAGYIENKLVGRKSVFWPTGMVLINDIRKFVVLRKAEYLHILKIMAAHKDGVKEYEFVRQLGTKQQNVNLWLKALVTEDVLMKQDGGRGARYFISPKLSTLVVEYSLRVKDYATYLQELLETDGLRPKKAVVRGTRLYVEVSLPAGKQKLSFECSPLATVSRILK